MPSQTRDDPPDPAADALAAALAGPRQVMSDGLMVRNYDLADQITAANYLQARSASRRPPWGVRFGRFIPPGTT